MDRKEIENRIRQEGLQLPPLRFNVVDGEITRRQNFRADILLEVQWKDDQYNFVAEIKTLGTPKAIKEACYQVQAYARPPEIFPMVVVPYLSPKQLEELEKQEISGVDLSGNGLVIVPGKLLICRSGKPNRFRLSDTIRNVYRGTTSLVARAFLLKRSYSAVKDILEFIKSREGNITFPTISKALKGLDEDLVINRKKDEMKMIQPDKLLDRLGENYKPPKVRTRFIGKCNLKPKEIIERLKTAGEPYQARIALTGSCSADKYVVMGREPILSVYCSEPPELLLDKANIETEPTKLFPNIELIETDNKLLYFDLRSESGIPYSSPIQTWLELFNGDKRQREVSEQLRKRLLNDAAENI